LPFSSWTTVERGTATAGGWKWMGLLMQPVALPPLPRPLPLLLPPLKAAAKGGIGLACAWIDDGCVGVGMERCQRARVSIDWKPE